jgi:hypothetical protein
MTDEFLFTCSECGRQFAPDPDAVVESGFSRGCVSKEDEARTIFSEDRVTAGTLRDMSDYHLAEVGLTPEGRERLLAGEEFVVTGAVCICLECQDRLLEEQESSQHCPK